MKDRYIFPQATIDALEAENDRLGAENIKLQMNVVAYERMVEEELKPDNARLRQQVKSLVEAWNTYWKRDEDDTLAERLNKLHAAFLAVQSAQEMEEK